MPSRESVHENAAYLTELDSAIGDADHGANMDRGMKAVVAAIDEGEFETADALFKKVGMTLVSTVGGASGPLYGTFFLRMGAALAGTEIDAADHRRGPARRGRGHRRARQGRARRQDDVRRLGAGPRRVRRGRQRGSRRPRSRRRPKAAADGRDSVDGVGGAQGPRELPRRAQRRTSGPGRDQHDAAARGRRQPRSRDRHRRRLAQPGAGRGGGGAGRRDGGGVGTAADRGRGRAGCDDVRH